MPVPGLTPELPLRAKVRIGQRVQGTRADGSKYERAASVDYFICPDEHFVAAFGEQPKRIIIRFPYSTLEECFPSGLEKWAKSKAGNPVLLCYTKGDGKAHGLGATRDGNTVKLDVKKPRQEIACPAFNCNFYGKEPHQGCRAQARLNFQIPGGPVDGVYRFETKGLDTIQGISAVLSQYSDLRGLHFGLSVTVVKKGQKQYPVVSICKVEDPAGGRADSGEAATPHSAPQETVSPPQPGLVHPGAGEADPFLVWVNEAPGISMRDCLLDLMMQHGIDWHKEPTKAWLREHGRDEAECERAARKLFARKAPR